MFRIMVFPKEKSKEFSKVKVVFPFKYDLGGIISNFEEAEKELKILYPNLRVDKRSLLSFNLSYLSIREPVLTLSHQTDLKINLNEKDYSFDQTIKLYPGGVISIIVSTELEKISTSELIDFYILFYEEKNRDYIPYLKQHKCDTKALAKSFEEKSKTLLPSQFEFGKIVDELRESISTFLKHRPYTYCFHDYRTLFFISDKFAEDDVLREADNLYRLVSLNKDITNSLNEIKELIEKSPVSYEDKYILNGNWASVFLLSGNIEFEERALTIFDLSHTFWYICQFWIFILDYITFTELITLEEISEKTFEEMINLILQLNNYQISVNQTLREVQSIDIMLKDPELCDIAKKFYDALGVNGHVQLVEGNLSLLNQHYQILYDFATQKINLATQKQTKMIEILIAISVAAGIAALIPGTYGLSIMWGLVTWSAVIVISLIYLIIYYKHVKIWKAIESLRKKIKRKG